MVSLLAGCSDAAQPTTTSSVVTTTSSVVTTTSSVVTTTSPVATTSIVATAPTTSVESPPAVTPTSASQPEVPEQLIGFELVTVDLDGRELLVAVADRADLRRRGLMGVERLGDLDGMVFVFDQDTTGGFWMKDTLLPLEIAFFTADGEFVDGFPMEPCTEADCPTYRPSDAYRYALEVPFGEMPDEIELLELRLEPSP